MAIECEEPDEKFDDGGRVGVGGRDGEACGAGEVDLGAGAAPAFVARDGREVSAVAVEVLVVVVEFDGGT